MLPRDTTDPFAGTVALRTFVTNKTAALSRSSAVMSHGPLIPLPARVSTGRPLLSMTMRQPACAVAAVPSEVGKLPTMTKPDFKATSAVVSPTPPGHGPGKLFGSSAAKTVIFPEASILSIVVPMPWRLDELLKLLTVLRTKFRIAGNVASVPKELSRRDLPAQLHALWKAAGLAK
jgi:hypothetical protein